VLLLTDDLFFRAKLGTVVERCGSRPVTTGSAPIAVVELTGADAVSQVRRLLADGIRVVAFGSHVDAAVLREAREAGAEAVPNSRVEAALAALLHGG
jgi:hypothetical protein